MKRPDMTLRNQHIVDLRLAGYTYGQIAQKVGISRQGCRSKYEKALRCARHPKFKNVPLSEIWFHINPKTHYSNPNAVRLQGPYQAAYYCMACGSYNYTHIPDCPFILARANLDATLARAAQDLDDIETAYLASTHETPHLA